MTVSSSRSLLGLRLLQLARPFLVILVLRIVDVELAARYVALLGVYVIALEIYNIVAPSDRLYLAEACVADLRVVLRRRAQYAAVIVPLSAWVLVRWVDQPWPAALLLALVSCANGFATALAAYLYARVPGRVLRTAEGLSWSVQLAAIALLLVGGHLLIGFVVYALEQTVRAAWLAGAAEPGTLRPRSGNTPPAPDAGHSVTALAIEGVTLTTANHIHRVPFVVAVGHIDPLFVVAAQVSAAVYNVLIGLSSRLVVPARHGLYVLMALALIGAVVVAQALGDVRARLCVQTVLLCALAVLHGAVMTHIPGQRGIVARPLTRALLLGGLATVIVTGATLSPAAFLFSPVVLALAGFVHARLNHAKV